MAVSQEHCFFQCFWDSKATPFYHITWAEFRQSKYTPIIEQYIIDHPQFIESHRVFKNISILIVTIYIMFMFLLTFIPHEKTMEALFWTLSVLAFISIFIVGYIFIKYRKAVVIKLKQVREDELLEKENERRRERYQMLPDLDPQTQSDSDLTELEY